MLHLCKLKQLSSFDVIFDFAGLGDNSLQYMKLLRPWSNAKLVTLMSPLLKSTDKNGILPGTIQTFVDLATKNIHTVINNNGCTFRYGYFIPNPYALKTITKYVEDGKVRKKNTLFCQFLSLMKIFDRKQKDTSKIMLYGKNFSWTINQKPATKVGTKQ